MKLILQIAIIIILIVVTPLSFAKDSQSILDLSLEELMEIETSTIGRKAVSAFESPLAVYILTNQDIKRSGATNIAEALRLIPGVQVARINSSEWAISIRGGNNRFANKLLVMIDGRIIYTPFFSGTFWEEQNYLMDDIERIEVVRGPGGSLWGSNAVNGIINIVTKSAQDTQKGLVYIGGGKEEQFLAGVRYGATIRDSLFFRTYAMYNHRDGMGTFGGDSQIDEWKSGQAGLRLDWGENSDNKFTVSGDVRVGQGDQLLFFDTANAIPDPVGDDTYNFFGGNILGNFRHDFNESSNLQFKIFYDHWHRNETNLYGINTNILDFDFQYRLPLPFRQDLIWGMGYRLYHYSFEPTLVFGLTPDNDVRHQINAFVQDEITIVPDHLSFQAGIKIEYSGYTGFEYQPSARLSYNINDDHFLWTAASRVVRIPSQLERNINAFNNICDGPICSTAHIIGNPDYDSEEVITFELGYRTKAIKNVRFDITGFYSFMDNLRTLEVGNTAISSLPGTFLEYVTMFDNKLSGRSAGFDIILDWQPLDWWKLTSSYSFLYQKFDLDSDSNHITLSSQAGFGEFSVTPNGHDPKHQFFIKSQMNLPFPSLGDTGSSKNLFFDVNARFVDTLHAEGPRRFQDPRVDWAPSYFELDFRIAWQVYPKVLLEIIGKNMIKTQHKEYALSYLIKAANTPNQRSLYGKLTWEF